MYTDRIEYWCQILRQKSNVSTSKNIIKDFSIKIGDYSGHFVTLDKAVAKLKSAMKELKAAKTVY